MSKRTQALKARHLRDVIIDLEAQDSLAKISDRYGVSRGTIHKWVRQEGYHQSRRGRGALAAQARARNMAERDWPVPEIAKLVNAEPTEVVAWIRQKQPPTRSDNRPVITITHLPSYKKRRIRNPQKKWKPRPKEVVKESDLPKPNLRRAAPKRIRGTWWTPEQEAYVLAMLDSGKYTIREIYEKTRASRRRQLRVWRKYRGPIGFPPNWPAQTPEEAEALWEARKVAAEERGTAELEAAEGAAEERRKRIAALEAETAQDEARIKELLQKRAAIAKRRKQIAAQVKAAEAFERRLPEAPEERARVLPGSYEAEVLKLPVGSLIKPKPRGRLPKPEGFGHHADNGRYFAVSNDWADLSDATKDELEIFARFLSRKQFPARVERKGDQPKAFFEDTWPKEVESRWLKVVGEGLRLLELYRDRKRALEKKKWDSPFIIKYLATVYDGYRNPSLNQRQKQDARRRLEKQWRELKRVDRLILTYALQVTEAPRGTDVEKVPIEGTGAPTTKGIDRGQRAKILLGREKPVRKLERRKREREKEAGEAAERAEIDAILTGAVERLEAGEEGEELTALPPAEEEEF